MGRLKTLTILLTLGAWGTATDGSPQDDAPPASTPARPQPPVHPSKYLEAAQRLAKTGDPRSASYAKAADDYRDMLSSDEQAKLDALLGKSPARTDSAIAAASARVADVPPSLADAPASNDSAVRDRAVGLVSQARLALANGKVDEARSLAQQALALNAGFSADEDHPGKVLAQIEKAAPTGLASRGASPTDAKQQGRWLLQSAREQIALGKYEEADQKLAQARALKVRWTLFDDTPSKVAEALEKARPKGAANSAGGSKGDKRQARAKLKEARELLDAGQTEQAEAIAAQVESWGIRYNMMEDTPAKVASAARALRRREMARNTGKGQPTEAMYAGLVATSRSLMQSGDLDHAELKARQAMSLNVTPSLSADRAESVLHDIAMAKAATPTAPVTTGPAPADPSVAPASTIQQVPESASAAAERAANSLLASGDRDAAAAKLVEAQNLKAQEDAASIAPAPSPLQDVPAPAPVAPLSDAPPDLAAAPPALGSAPAPEGVPSAPGGNPLDQARALLSGGNYPAARQAAMQAKAAGAGLEADQLLAQIGQTEQAAAFQIYESALASIRKGTEADMGHARGLLNELSSLDLDESTKQKVEDLLMKLPREGAGRAEIGQVTVEDKEIVAAQRLNAEVGTKIAEAKKVMETDPVKAIGILTATIDQVKAAGSKETVTRNMTRRLEANIELFKKDKVAFDEKMKDKAYRAEIETKKLRILEADKVKKERIKVLMQGAEAAMADGKFDEAEKKYGLVASIEPNEVAARAGQFVARTRRYYERDKDIKAQKEDAFVGLMQDVDASGITPRGLMNGGAIDLGEGFKALTQSRRDLALRLAPRRNPQVVETEKALQKEISINTDKTTLGEAIKYLTELTGMNIVVDKKALAEEALTLNSPVELHANRMKTKSVLKYMLSDLSLTYTVDEEGTLLITSPQANQKRTYPVVYTVADLVVPVNGRSTPANPGSNNLPPGIPGGGQNMATDPAVLQAQAAAMNGAQGVFQAPQGQDGATARDGLRQDRDLDFDPLIALIKAAVAPGTWSNYHGAADSMGGYGQGAGMADAGGAEDTAIGTITPFFLNISLIIRHTAEVHDDIVDLLRQLRKLQDLQVSIEVRFISVSDSFFEQIGVDFDFSIQSDAVGPKSSFAVPNPAAGIGGGAAGAGAGAGGTAVNPFLINPIRDHTIGNQPPLIVGHTGPSTGNGNPGDFTSDLQLPFTQGSAGSIAPFNALSGSTAATFGIAFLSDLEVYLFLTAVQGDTRSNLVQAPKVTSFNGANATITNNTSRNFVQQLTPIVSAGSVAFQPQIGNIPDGVTLNVTPVVSADRRYVRMTLSPVFITFIQFDTFSVPAAVGGGGLGGQSSAINAQIQLPVFSITNVQTTVTVPDGGTVLLGGVKRLREERREFGVPILAKTPLINRRFRNIGIGRTTDSLMMMVTPRIIILEEEEEKLGIPSVQNLGVTF